MVNYFEIVSMPSWQIFLIKFHIQTRMVSFVVYPRRAREQEQFESSQNRNVRHILCSAAALINVFKMAAHLDAKYAIEMIFDTSSTKMRLKLTLKWK